MKHGLRVFMIGWEFPPAIAGGLGMACAGLADALGKRGHDVQFLLPHATGAEETHPGVNVFDIRRHADRLAPAERALLLSDHARRAARIAKRAYGFDSPLSGYNSAGYVPPAEPVGTPAERAAGSDGHAGPGAHAADPGTDSEKSAQANWSDAAIADRVVEADCRNSYSDAAPAGEAALQALRGGYGPNIYEEIHAYARQAAALARTLDYDLIHVHDWMTYPAGLAAARASGKPLVAHIHATEYDRSGESGGNQRVRRLERMGLGGAHRVAAVSRFTRDLICDRYGVAPERVDVVHNGVDLQESLRHAPRADEERPRGVRDPLVLFLGRITHQKGPEYFIRAAQRVIERKPRVRFVMAGSGDQMQRMIAMASELGIGRHFHFTGALGRKEVAAIYRQSDLYIMPSVSEPFGIAPLEAAAHGTPVLLSRQSGVSEVMRGALRTDFWNVDDMAGKILFALEHPALCQALSDQGASEARRLTWERTAQGLEGAYERALSTAGVG